MGCGLRVAGRSSDYKFCNGKLFTSQETYNLKSVPKFAFYVGPKKEGKPK